MTIPAALFALTLAAAAHGGEPPPSDLDLYASSMLAGLHSHPVGLEGRRLDRAERALARRRASLRAWLVTRIGEAPVAQVENDIQEEVESVYWTRGPTLEEEWDNIARASRILSRLERRRRRAQRSN